MLLEADADIDHVTKNGSCLHESALYGKTDVVKLLLEVRNISCIKLLLHNVLCNCFFIFLLFLACNPTLEGLSHNELLLSTTMTANVCFNHCSGELTPMRSTMKATLLWKKSISSQALQPRQTLNIF